MGRLLYDPDCGFCTAAANRIRPWCGRNVVVPMTAAELVGGQVDADRARREIPFVDDDGRVRYGAAAIGAALLDGGVPARVVGTLLASRAGSVVANPIYRIIARHRHRLPGGTPACTLGGGS